MDFVRDDERCSSSVFLSYKMVPEDEEEAEALLPAKKAFSVLISDTDTIAGITQESIKFVNEESRMESSSAQNELTMNAQKVIAMCGVPYERLYFAFREMEKAILCTPVQIRMDLNAIRQNSSNWKAIGEEGSESFFEDIDFWRHRLHTVEWFELWLIESMDIILDIKTSKEVFRYLRFCSSKGVRPGNYYKPSVWWFTRWLMNTESPWSSKRAKKHIFMLKWAFRKHVTREKFKIFGDFRRTCINRPFVDGYDARKCYEECIKNCVDCQNLLPILRMHAQFLEWLDVGNSERRDFMSSLLDKNCALNIKSSDDIPDKFVDDCNRMFLKLPKKLIRDIICDVIMVRQKEIEAKVELEALRLIIDHNCVRNESIMHDDQNETSMHDDIVQNGESMHDHWNDSNVHGNIDKALLHKIPEHVYEYVITWYQNYRKEIEDDDKLIEQFRFELNKQIEVYKSTVCYYYGEYEVDYD